MRLSKSITIGAVVIAIAVVAGLLIVGLQDERTRVLLTAPRGQIREGTKFGVTVGDSWDEADRGVRSRFDPAFVTWTVGGCGPSAERYADVIPALTGTATVSYSDPSWQHGWVDLCLRDGVVTEILWLYVGPFFIDP